tara:strand:+ start:574 stop:765 length:192 start_codon:yes stop_codon:yes gene_type:complete
MTSIQEDIIMEIYNEIVDKGMKKEFDIQIKKMKEQKKNKYKSIVERWEYALYRIKGGESKNVY